MENSRERNRQKIKLRRNERGEGDVRTRGENKKTRGISPKKERFLHAGLLCLCIFIPWASYEKVSVLQEFLLLSSSLSLSSSFFFSSMHRTILPTCISPLPIKIARLLPWRKKCAQACDVLYLLLFLVFFLFALPRFSRFFDPFQPTQRKKGRVFSHVLLGLSFSSLVFV